MGCVLVGRTLCSAALHFVHLPFWDERSHAPIFLARCGQWELCGMPSSFGEWECHEWVFVDASDSSIPGCASKPLDNKYIQRR